MPSKIVKQLNDLNKLEETSFIDELLWSINICHKNRTQFTELCQHYINKQSLLS